MEPSTRPRALSLPGAANLSLRARLLALLCAAALLPMALIGILESRAASSSLIGDRRAQLAEAAAGFDAALTTWLDETTPLSVHLAADGQPPAAGHRPSATHLFASVARVLGARAVGVVLTGMGGDGTAGLLALRHASGLVLTQDQASCVVPGMPAAAVAAGAVDEVVALDRLGARIAAAWAPAC